MKLSGQNRQWIWSRSRSARQASSCGKTSSGLDASRINSPQRGVGEIFLLTSPLIGQLTKGLNRNLPFGKLLCSLIKYLIFNNIPDLYRWSRIGRARFSQNSSYLDRVLDTQGGVHDTSTPAHAGRSPAAQLFRTHDSSLHRDCC